MSNVISNKSNMMQYFYQCFSSLLLVNDLKLIPPPPQRKKPSDAPTQCFCHCFSLLFDKDLTLDFSSPQHKKASYAPVFISVDLINFVRPRTYLHFH